MSTRREPGMCSKVTVSASDLRFNLPVLPVLSIVAGPAGSFCALLLSPTVQKNLGLGAVG